MNKEKITILGAGLVGSLLSIYMSKRGYKVNIFERRPDMRKEQVVAGRSINMALSDRGWTALDGIGIGDEVRKISIPMYGRMIHSVKGELTYQQYGKENEAIYSVSRRELNCKLMELAEAQPNVDIYFNERCLDVDLDNNEVVLENLKVNQKKRVYGDRIFGTDGAFSAARLRMQMNDRFDYSQTYLKHGYKELTIPANADGTWKMEKNALHIWPRGEYMLIALPNQDGSFTCTLFFPFDGEKSFNSIKTEADLVSFFTEIFPDTFELMPTLIHDYFHNPTASLVLIKCEPWNYKDKLMLLGDASHAIVPFYGQGMNSGFEDCTVFNKLFDEHNGDLKTMFPEFSKTRKPDADAIAELALRNFIEMRDLVGDPTFLLRKKIEAKIFQKFPEKWMPLYSMVTFSDIPYSEALKEGIRQDGIMEKIMTIPGIEEKWDSKEVEDMILSNL